MYLLVNNSFTVRRFAIAVYVVMCLCESHTPVGPIVSKRPNLGSCKQRQTIDKGLSFLMQKLSAKFEWDHPLLTEAPNAGGVG